MAGRPKKKPEYNPELQFNHFLQELSIHGREGHGLFERMQGTVF